MVILLFSLALGTKGQASQLDCRCQNKVTDQEMVTANICDTKKPCDEFSACQLTPTSPGYKCQCYAGFIPKTNTTCNDRDECNFSKTVCPNGACINTWGSFQCMCNPGYAGRHCQNFVNPCAVSPCLNGGTCVNSNASATGLECQCPAGYSLPHCTDIDECSMSNYSTCYNGECFNTIGSYYCECFDGYSGGNCRDQSDPCVFAPCPAYSNCDKADEAPGYKCTCYAGFIAPNCTDRDECSMGSGNVCHHGTCLNTLGSYKCTCNTGFSGAHCTKNITCNSSPCSNGGTCITSDTGYSCLCPSGYTSPNCSDIDECIENPNICGHGSCVNVPGSYHCLCTGGYTGTHCAGMLSTTSPTPASSMSTHTASTVSDTHISTKATTFSSISTNSTAPSTKAVSQSTSTPISTPISSTSTPISSTSTTASSQSSSTATSTTSTAASATSAATLIKSTSTVTSSQPSSTSTTITSTSSKQGTTRTNKSGVTLRNQDEAKKKSWVGGHWWIFIIAGAVVCLVAAVTGILIRRRRLADTSQYGHFNMEDVPSTPTTPDPVTAENPLYEALHVVKTTDTPAVDDRSAYMTIKGTDQNVSDI